MKTSFTAVEPLSYHEETPKNILDGIADVLIPEMPLPQRNLGVIVTIPAHNEEETIASCLKALANQKARAKVQIDHRSFEVLVLCHNCTDRTASKCREIQADYPYLNLQILEIDRSEVNNVGAVRRVGMRIASARLATENGYIVTTDADTMTHRYFIANILGYMGSDYGLICGRININMDGIDENARKTLEHKQNYFQLRTRLEHLISPDRKNPWPRHSHNSGPNLAVRNDVYTAVGGMPPKGFLEDIALYNAVCRNGFLIRHCPYTIVTTSSRTNSRTPWGFGSELRDWSEVENIFFKVEGLDRLLAKFRIFKKVREDYISTSQRLVSEISRETNIPIERIQNYIKKIHVPGPLINSIDRKLDGLEDWQAKYPLKLVNEAEKELRDYLGNPSVDFCQT